MVLSRRKREEWALMNVGEGMGGGISKSELKSGTILSDQALSLDRGGGRVD